MGPWRCVGDRPRLATPAAPRCVYPACVGAWRNNDTKAQKTKCAGTGAGVSRLRMPLLRMDATMCRVSRSSNGLIRFFDSRLLGCLGSSTVIALMVLKFFLYDWRPLLRDIGEPWCNLSVRVLASLNPTSNTKNGSFGRVFGRFFQRKFVEKCKNTLLAKTLKIVIFPREN